MCTLANFGTVCLDGRKKLAVGKTDDLEPMRWNPLSCYYRPVKRILVYTGKFWKLIICINRRIRQSWRQKNAHLVTLVTVQRQDSVKLVEIRESWMLHSMSGYSECLFQQQWLPPEVSSGSGGNELPAVSLLGPFMAVSVFADENPAVAEKYFSGKTNPAAVRTIAQTLQQDLEFMRVFTLS